MSDDDPTSDLSLASTDALIEELMNRHEGVVIVRESVPDAAGEQHDCQFSFSGGVSRAIGMCERMKRHLLRGGWSNTDDDEDEDD